MNKTSPIDIQVETLNDAILIENWLRLLVPWIVTVTILTKGMNKSSAKAVQWFHKDTMVVQRNITDWSDLLLLQLHKI